MTYQFRPWQFPVLVAMLCASVVGALYYYQGREKSAAEMMRYLPPTEGATLFVDVKALRVSGVLDRLTGSPTMQEPEYQSFVKETGFDYTQDLNSVLVRFAPKVTYMVLTGRFRWDELARYVTTSGGKCRSRNCEMAGSVPGRRISMVAINNRTLGLVVAEGSAGIAPLTDVRPKTKLQLPTQPVWLTVPPSVLKADEKLPPGTRLFGKALGDAESVTFTLGAAGKAFQAEMEARCHSSLAAQSLLNQMTGLTELVKNYINRTGQTANAGDLSGVLTSGAFTRQNNVVRGVWPIQWAFLNGLSGR